MSFSPNTRQYDAFEIHPALEYEPYAGAGLTVEQVETWAEALNMAGEYSGRAFWILYGHCTGDGLEVIAETKTEDDARVMLYKITGIIATAGNPGPYMAKR